MPRGKAKQDTDMLTMALYGYEQKKVEIDAKIKEIRGLLGGTRSVGSVNGASTEKAVAPAPRRKRVLSAEARKRIAQAQKRRWAEHRRKSSQAAE